jgi:hypothetical protein
MPDEEPKNRTRPDWGSREERWISDMGSGIAHNSEQELSYVPSIYSGIRVGGPDWSRARRSPVLAWLALHVSPVGDRHSRSNGVLKDFITYLEQQTCPCIIVAVFRRVVSNRAIVARFALITLPCSMKPSDGPLQKLLGEQWA